MVATALRPGQAGGACAGRGGLPRGRGSW
jgi:hypothetical protein